MDNIVKTALGKMSMPGTEASQEEYPQPKSQKNGQGFPRLRVLILVALGRDAVLNSAAAACKGKGTGEQALLRQVSSSLKPNEILLADSNFENDFNLCQLRTEGMDGVFENGYPLALVMMLVSAMGTYAFFKRKGWL